MKPSLGGSASRQLVHPKRSDPNATQQKAGETPVFPGAIANSTVE